MTTVRIPYGHGGVEVEFPNDVTVDVIELAERDAAADPTGEVRRALAAPIGGFAWPGRVESVAIAVNDKTRPVPHAHLVPPLLDQLEQSGIGTDAITFHVAVGGHPPMMPHEFADILPREVVERYRIVSHDADCADALAVLGTTSRGTPVRVDRAFAEADLKVVIGTIEPHQFVGFSGGVKSAAIGLAGRPTIEANHSLMTHPGSRIGDYGSNPARQDIEEIGALIGIDLAVNVILDARRDIVRVLAGDPVEVMNVGVPLAREFGQVAVDHRYDLVVASPGGHPKDVNVYQAQKAVASAAQIVRPGGTIVLLAACPEGAGSDHYEDWVAKRSSHADVLARFAAERFRVGPHKAFQLARDARTARLLVHSEMPDDLVQRLLLEPVDDLQRAVDDALAGLPPVPRVAVLPHAATTMPVAAV